MHSEGASCAEPVDEHSFGNERSIGQRLGWNAWHWRNFTAFSAVPLRFIQVIIQLLYTFLVGSIPLFTKKTS